MTSRRQPQSTLPPGLRPDRNDDDIVMSGGMFAVAAVVAFIVLAILAVRFGTAAVEGDIETRANGLLAANDLESVNVEATGTDVVLSGTIEEGRNADAIFAAVAGLQGVTSVEGKLWELSSGSDEEIIITGDSVEIEWSGNSVVVRGDVSTPERRDAITSTLTDAFTRVDVDDLNVVEGIADESDWLGNILGLVLFSKDQLDEGLLIVAPASEILVLSGEVDEKSVRNELNDQATEVAAEIGFDATPAVRVPGNLPTEEEVEELQIDLNALLEDKVVEFETKSDVITERGKELLDEILATLVLKPNVRIEIGGHTDSQGSAEANMELSLARANAALAYLVASGEDPERFDVVAYGESEPIASNDTAAGRAKNRRIEFTALLAEAGDE